MLITEAYKNKLAISEQVYAREHGGRALAPTKKVAIARVLANTSEFLNEAFENSQGTQLGNMKTFKKFCLDLTTVALPNLIANDLVIVFPMKSRTGYIQYLSFVAGSNKGGVKQGDLFNDPFRLGEMTDDRVNYTAAVVTDTVVTGAEYEGDAYEQGLGWKTIVAEGFKTIVVDNKEVEFAEDFINKYTEAQLKTIAFKKFKIATPVIVEQKVTGYNITFANVIEETTAGQKISYKYDNVQIPQNDLPILNAKIDGIGLEAKARRIAIYYSQMAAFQAKTEMGIDLGEILATQACAELSYQIDTEVVKLLNNAAGAALEKFTFNKALPYGVNKRDHYASFAETIEEAATEIYLRTQKYGANYMIISPLLKPMFTLMDGYKPASNIKMNGPYFAGTLNGLKVYVSPVIEANRYVVGYNGDDMVTSAAVYAPYMAVVPTQLLGFADGGMSQGFSTMYDLKLLNPLLLAAGQVINDPTKYIVYEKTSA